VAHDTPAGLPFVWQILGIAELGSAACWYRNVKRGAVLIPQGSKRAAGSVLITLGRMIRIAVLGALALEIRKGGRNPGSAREELGRLKDLDGCSGKESRSGRCLLSFLAEMPKKISRNHSGKYLDS